MRTTLILEPDVARLLEIEMRRSGKTLKATVNEAPRFEVEPHAFGFKPGIDLDRMNQLVDELEAEDVARKLRP